MGKVERKRESWQERRKKIKHEWAVPFIFLEWNCERLSSLLKQWAFLEVLEHLGRLTIIVAIVFYFTESGSRRKAKHYQAWQVINLAQGKTGSGGRIDALQDLNKDKVSLAGVDISKAILPKLNLASAELGSANLTNTELVHSNFAGANLYGASLAEARLSSANLADAILINVDLHGADLCGVNLTGATLRYANLSDVELCNANLTGANLHITNLTGANLSNASLAEAALVGADVSGTYFSEADLSKADLRDISLWQNIKRIKHANIYDVKNAPDGFIEWATENGAVSIESDKEWQKLINEKPADEAKQQEVGNNSRDQKAAGEK